MDILKQFISPPDAYRPIPFWWWVGEPLTKERLAWQLDQIRAKGVLGVIISYNHTPEGGTDVGDPPLFSKDWWDLFRWVVAYCKQHGMKIGIKDYTLINPAMREVGRQSPEMNGFGSLRHASQRIHGGTEVVLDVIKGTTLLSAHAYKVAGETLQMESAVDLTAAVTAGVLHWQAPAGEWQVVVVSVEAHDFDPTHPAAGAKTIDALYGVFERECPGEMGQTINLFFQDELNFFEHTASHLPVFSTRIATVFQKRKGYDVTPLLPALWHDLGPVTAKVRIDYNDVTTALMEEGFFRPIFDWCDRRGVMLAQDNHGRGRILIGRKLYGDYFRTMRWYHAPGTEDSGLHRGGFFKGFKINSSIAHLYGRPRVWNEAFHSSGWGFTPAQIIAGFNEDCAYGATAFNLHGLYYTTFGGWWEWAPPDFHFRQPYWEQTGAMNDYIARVSYLLSAGVHQCDVAIVNPITTIEAGIHGAEEESEQQAFGLGRHLFDAGIDFDFIDFESIERAVARDGELQVSGERYRVLIFPMMGAVRYSSLEKAREFARAGGLVIFYGCQPHASDRAGSHDAQVESLVREIKGEFIAKDFKIVQELIGKRIVCDFIPAESDIYGLHRQVDGRQVYFVFNRTDHARDVEIFFRAQGRVERWDAWSGETQSLSALQTDAHGTTVKLHLEPREGQLVVFGEGRSAIAPVPVVPAKSIIPLNDPWEFELQPTLNNQFGDFRQPASIECLGAEIRLFRYHEETEPNPNWSAANLDDSNWRTVMNSFGPRLWKLGPIPPGTDTTALEAELKQLTALDPSQLVILNGQSFQWTPYEFSLRWGIEFENRAGEMHGLKGKVPDEFIHLPATGTGAIHYMWSSVVSPTAQTLPFEMGSRCAFESWLNGIAALSQQQSVRPPTRFGWRTIPQPLPVQETKVQLQRGGNPLLLKFMAGAELPVNAYAAFDAPPPNATLGLRWYSKPGVPAFDFRPGHDRHAGWYRFQSPPGLAALTITARGTIQVWVNGQPATVEAIGSQQYRAVVANPAPDAATVAIRVQQSPDSYAGDSLPKPVQLTCVAGKASVGDWSENGLACYSGGAWYRKTITLSREQASAASIQLQLGQVACAAEIFLNGRLIDKKITPPWSVELAGFVQAGENRLEILVTNTLANFYSVGIPTRYVFPGQTVSGLLGPVRLEISL